MQLDNAQFQAGIARTQAEVQRLKVSMDTDFRTLGAGSLKQSFDESTLAISGANLGARGMIRTMMGLEAVGSGSLRGLMSGMAGLSMMFGEAGMAVATYGVALYGAIRAGDWLGEKIGNWLVPLNAVDKNLLEMRKKFEELDKIKMDQLKDTLTGLGKIMAPYIQQFERTTRRKTGVAGSESEARIAEIQATYSEGPEKERLLADERMRAASEKAKAETDLANDSIAAAQEQKDHAEAELRSLKEDVKNAPSRWETKSAEMRLEAARPKLEAIIDAAMEQIADSSAAIAEAAARKKAAEWESLGTQAKANEEEWNASQPIPPKATRLDIASDRLSKIGLYMGGPGTVDLARKTATATERMAKTLDKYLPKLVPQGNTVEGWS